MAEIKLDINCPIREENNTYCSCPKTECENHGICCKCILSHKNRENVPFHVKFPHCLRDQLSEIGYTPEAKKK